MNEVSDYTQPAEECRAMAAKTKDYEIGRKLIAMARAWESLPETAESSLSGNGGIEWRSADDGMSEGPRTDYSLRQAKRART